MVSGDRERSIFVMCRRSSLCPNGRATADRGANVKPVVLVLVLASAFTARVEQNPQAIMNRAVAAFEKGQFAESATAFDELAKTVPEQAPQLWQRGIALYYAGRYDDCREQFESHRTVNPNDAENAAWHFLCVARAESPAKAKAALLPVGPDGRVPMHEVYEMFKGAMTPEQVMKAAGESASGQFYGNLYLGLYFEATGDPKRARTWIEAAASERYRPVGGY